MFNKSKKKIGCNTPTYIPPPMPKVIPPKENTMTLEKAISICQARIDLDRSMRDNKVESDYEKFCENECMAIEMLIKYCKLKQEDY